MDEIRCYVIKGMDMNELQAAIDRLKKVPTACTSSYDALKVFMGKDMWTANELRDTLVDVLMQAESKWWSNHPTIREDLESLNDELLANMGFMRLPVDRDGEIIRIGDELCGYGCPDGGVYCQATDGHLILAGTKGSGYRDWLLWMPRECAHYHKPTVDDVMREFEDKWSYVVDNGDKNVTAALVIECADKLREVMQA